MLNGKIHNLCHFGLGNLICKDAALADTVIVDVEHDLRGFGLRLLKKTDQDMNDKFHRCVIVVQHEHPVKVRALCYCLCLGCDIGVETVVPVAGFVLFPGHVQTKRNVVQGFQ